MNDEIQCVPPSYVIAFGLHWLDSFISCNIERAISQFPFRSAVHMTAEYIKTLGFTPFIFADSKRCNADSKSGSAALLQTLIALVYVTAVAIT